MGGDLVSWNNIQELMEEVQHEHTSGKWRLFIDSSKVRLMAMLLQFSSVSMAHAIHMKEICGNLQDLLRKIRYEQHRWNKCADLKL